VPKPALLNENSGANSLPDFAKFYGVQYSVDVAEKQHPVLDLHFVGRVVLNGVTIATSWSRISDTAQSLAIDRAWSRIRTLADQH
jgi:hypothetical protein